VDVISRLAQTDI